MYGMDQSVELRLTPNLKSGKHFDDQFSSPVNVTRSQVLSLSPRGRTLQVKEFLIGTPNEFSESTLPATLHVPVSALILMARSLENFAVVGALRPSMTNFSHA
ncbi:hypothetical protein ACQPZ8_28435 [Actinomadura nitritigenes]|uniref:hypothetical protein n=1 Tax=Actinomadura nitritigenes TaxID=134602 RepID=UPI003D8CB3D7